MKDLRYLAKSIETIRVLDSTMPIQTFAVFLYVALHEGEMVSDVAKALGLTVPTTSRNIRALTKTSWLKRPGLDLLRIQFNKNDIRVKQVHLTTKGKHIASQLEKV